MPTPKAASICLSQKQQTLLQQIVRRTTNPHRLVRRAKLILAAASGVSNAQISQQLQLDRGQVRLWRTRWLEGTPNLTAAEVEGVNDRDLSERISLLLDDRARPGTANYFNTEQVVQIVAIACETPQTSEHPICHWTPTELVAEALKRGIVEKISPRSVGRFLKRGDFTASSPPLLVKCQS